MVEHPPFPGTNEATLLVVINRAWRPGMTETQIYEIARGHWRVANSTRSSVSLVIAAADGVIRGAYRPSSWFPSPRPGEQGRWGFDGIVAENTGDGVGTSVAHLRSPRGAANPVRVYLNGVPAKGSIDAGPSYTWDVEPGDYLSRAERSEIYGGATQGGMEPSASTPNVFLYTDPISGLKHGYSFDGWNEDRSVFFYTGEGRVGPQLMREGNKAVREHVLDGRALRLFVADGPEPGSQTLRQLYLGEFRVDDEDPYFVEYAPDTFGDTRSVFVFRLRPVGSVMRRLVDVSPNPLSDEVTVESDVLVAASFDDYVEEVEVEFIHSPDNMHVVYEHVVTLIRREAELVWRLRDYLISEGSEPVRHRVRPRGSAFDLLTDIYDPHGGVLYEAKSASSRESVRMAIGQLADYRRYMPAGTRNAILLPALPAVDLQDLVFDLGMGLCVPEGKKVFAHYWPA